MSVQQYEPTTLKEQKTLIHIACISCLSQKDIGDVNQRIGYVQNYLIGRYGTNPEDNSVPLFFRDKFNLDTLDLDLWTAVALVYVSKNNHKLKRDIRLALRKAEKKLRRYCKKH